MASKPVQFATRPVFWILRRLADGDIFRRMAPQAPPAEAAPILRIAVCDLIPNLGDKVMMFPVIDLLRAENPTAEITWFTSSRDRILQHHPAIDRLLRAAPEADVRGRFQPIGSVLGILRWWRRELQDLRFDTVVVLRGGVEPFHSHHLAWLLGGRRRVAYDPDLEPERPDQNRYIRPLMSELVPAITGAHEVSRAAEVLALAGLASRPVDLTQPVQSLIAVARTPDARAFLERHGLNHQTYAIVSPGASQLRRAWPADRFAELARRELLTRGWFPVLVGGPELAPEAAEIAGLLDGNALDLTGQTSFEELVAVCGNAQAFLGNDSGTAHIAGACGVPTLIVTAFARSGRRTHHASPWRSHPVGPRVAVAQPATQLTPCTTECVSLTRHCILQVDVDEMQQAFQKLLGDAGIGVPSLPGNASSAS